MATASKTNGQIRQLTCMMVGAAVVLIAPGIARAEHRVEAGGGRVWVAPRYELRGRVVVTPPRYEWRNVEVCHDPTYEVRRLRERRPPVFVGDRAPVVPECGQAIGYRNTRRMTRSAQTGWRERRILVREGFCETVRRRVLVRRGTKKIVRERVLVRPGQWVGSRGGRLDPSPARLQNRFQLRSRTNRL